MLDYLVPGLLLLICGIGLGKGRDPYSLMLSGAADGLNLLKTILPTLIILLTAVSMLRASGAVEIIGRFCAPVFHWVGIPPETAILVLIRPISGSAALAVGAELIGQYGVDSMIGRTTAVMLGSTETTFYTIAVYFAAAKVGRTRYAVPAALCGDVAGFLAASWAVRMFFYS